MSKKKFKRQNHSLDRLGDSWRKPRGRHSKLRLNRKGRGKKPSPGYGSEHKGMHPSGYYEKLVHNPDELDDIDKEEEAARIASTVGKRKRKLIREKAEKEDIKILN
ncbi:MAG: 50S ribosomal protein L32e [Candidatus Aenigmatarchaeota archaeon]